MEPSLKEPKRGLNATDIQLGLLKVLHVSFETSYTFMQKHPLVSGALLVFLILYIFLSFIYNLLVFLSPFFVCTAIFVRIFWSSEQTQKSINNEKKNGVEEISPEMLRIERRNLLYKYPSQNATSRRRNFTGRKLDVYGGLEIKAKDLSSVFRNEFTRNNYNGIGSSKLYEEEIGSLDAPIKHVLFSEPSMLDLVDHGASFDSLEENTEENKEEDEKKPQESGGIDKGELTEDEQKIQMELGTCELERHKRLESLIARRRARKQLKLQIEKGLIDMKSVTPSQIAPLFVSRLNPFDSPRELQGIKVPGSAPSALRSPFDIPYDPFEEKPILTGDSFDQELKGLFLEPRQEDLQVRGHRLAHPRVRRLQGLGSHDKLGKLLLSKEASKCESKASILSSEWETTHEDNGRCESDNIDGITGDGEVGNAEAAKSMSDHASESDLNPMTNVEGAKVSEMVEEPPRVPKPQDRNLSLPISSASVTKLNNSLHGTLSPNKETMSFTGRRIRHVPSCSLASDLHVEVSSPTLTLDENHETNTTTDGESMIYDGDIDRDVTSGSEDMWGASLHLREARRLSEQDISELNSWRDISSPLSMQNIDEENAADVSSMSSRSDIPDDTPTYAVNSDHNSIFGNLKDFGEPHQNSHSSVVSERWKRLMQLMDNHLPHERHSKKQGELFNLSENSSKAQVINDGNNSTAASEQDNTHNNSRGNEEPGASESVKKQEVTYEVSISSSSSSSSPRSVLSITQKTIAGQVPLPASNQEAHQDVQQSNMQDVSQETLNGEGPLHSIPQNIQPSMDDPNVESHNSDLSHPQEQTFPLENSIQESNMSSKMNGAEDCNKDNEKKLKNDENSGDKLTRLIIPHASAETPRQAGMMTTGDISEELREIFDDNVPLISLILESSLESPGEEEDDGSSQASVRQEAITDTSSDEDFERKCDDLNQNQATLSSCLSVGESDKLRETDKPKHSPEEVNYLQSESKQVVEDHMEKENLDKGDAFEDSPLPIITGVTNSEDMEGEWDKISKNEATDQEFNNNEDHIEKENLGKGDASEDSPLPITTELTNSKDTEGECNKISKDEATDQELNKNEDHMEKENLEKGDAFEDSPLPITTEVTNSEDTEGERDKMNKNEATDQELNKNETMAMSEPEGETNHIRNIEHMIDPEEERTPT